MYCDMGAGSWGARLSSNVEIVFSTEGCFDRTVSDFIGLFIGLIVVSVVGYVLRMRLRDWGTEKSERGYVKLDRAAIYSLFTLVVIGIGALSLGNALRQTNTSLLAVGDRIEVRGCIRARQFRSSFDRDVMSATYKFVLGKSRRSNAHELVLRQKDQRTVKIKLGDPERDGKLVSIAPDAMKQYAQKLRDTGMTVPVALQHLVPE